MAKWGQGDPRWIVEEREDAKNVNNWHWSEKNATQWSKDYFKQLLIGAKIENDEYYVEITDLPKMQGEAMANNRKAKVIVFYEWDLELTWQGSLKNSDNKTEYKGKIQVPNLSEEYDANEIEIDVSVEKESPNGLKLKDFIRKVGLQFMRKKLGEYINDLKTDFTKDLILPTKKVNPLQTSPGPANNQSSNSIKKSMNEVVKSTNSSQDNTKTSTTTIELVDEFICAPNDLFQVLLNKDLVNAFTRSSSEIDGKTGGEFSLFGDTITGLFVEIDSPKYLHMKWRHKSWGQNVHSDVEMKFEPIESGTRLRLTQKGVPSSQESSTKQGWMQNYFHAIKMTFGYGGRLF